MKGDVELRTICFIEDSEIDFELAVKAISTFATNTTAIRITSYDQIVQELAFAPLCLIVVDINLPCHNGLDILRRLMPRLVREPVGVVVFSTSASKEDRKKALELGAHDYRIKPTDAHDFVSVVKDFVAPWLTGGEQSRSPKNLQ